MADPGNGAGDTPAEGDAARAAHVERLPVMQQVLDNPFLLLFIGVAVPAVFYLMWGVMEVAQIPIAK